MCVCVRGGEGVGVHGWWHKAVSTKTAEFSFASNMFC